MKTKTNVKAGNPGIVMQHNQSSAALKVQTHIKAGPTPKSRRIVELQSS